MGDLLNWVYNAVKEHQGSIQESSGPGLHLLILASLCDCSEVIPPSFNITAAQLKELQSEAKRQLRDRLRDVTGRKLMIHAWEQAGISAVTHASSTAA
ncbi:hypothetical protein Verru16b_01406 [Lacunisphaera limnophila]|uniref:Uncharacterized protein n=1 Tax=Lacunisphaera limnophila TaxID=1838286 RepID=A0A1D8ATX3_9BACT|nr:hypothetical protein Verru16b_01406 [Lacunisphaera limnophila]